MVKCLSENELTKLPRANLAEMIIDEIKALEKDIQLNELKEDITLSWTNGQRKIRIHNLIRILTVIVQECKYFPHNANLVLGSKHLLGFLKKLNNTFDNNEHNNWIIGRRNKQQIHSKDSPHTLNLQLNKIISLLEEWREILKSKVDIKPGNDHLHKAYHPQFVSTYRYKPRIIPDDYRANFFFTAYVRELFYLTTMILIHPCNETQIMRHEERKEGEIFNVDINVDLQDKMSIEKADNIRAMRVHGPNDDKNYPGSYLVVLGGHHRTYLMYRYYLQGLIKPNKELLIQLVEEKDFSNSKKYFKKLKGEINRRVKIRKQIHSLK